jgi:glycerol-3-phosphate dehydrogenase
MLDTFLDAHWPSSLDDIRRGTRLGMGPCQGGFCTFRAVGVMAERLASDVVVAPEGGIDGGTGLDRTLTDFLEERFKGTRPIAWGRQLQELWLMSGIYSGVLGIDSLDGASPIGDAAARPVAAPTREARDGAG